MINSVADFLLELKDKEQELLKKYDIVKHPGIIGEMYEGLTKDIPAIRDLKSRIQIVGFPIRKNFK